MSSSKKRKVAAADGMNGLQSLPASIMVNEILLKLGLETLCSVSCVCRVLRSSVSQALPLLPDLNLSEISPDARSLNHIIRRCRGIGIITLNCRRVDDSLLRGFLEYSFVELNLLSCSLLSSRVFAYIGEICPNLRVLMVEMVDLDPPEVFKCNIGRMLRGCLYLESLCIKIRGTEVDASCFGSTELILPKTIKTLKLRPVLGKDVFNLINGCRTSRNRLETSTLSDPFSPMSSVLKLQSLSLLLDVISDEFIISISNSLPLLKELDLEDRLKKEPSLQHDLSNTGLQSLGSCHHLTSLSLIRSRLNHTVSFKRVNDIGMFLLSEGLKGLESVRLCGFSRVSDAGFASILHSCQNLKKFEIRNALVLSDLAFHDLIGAPCSLVELRLLSCNLITSETVKKLGTSRNLEVLDLCGCRSIADSCLDSISRLRKLTSLNLTGADITDSGLSLLGKGSPPITHLCLRGCRRVHDKGISHLLHHGGTIRKTLSILDLGQMPGISDKAILTIVATCTEITELSIRNCFYVTDSSVEALAMRKNFNDGSKLLRRLDFYNCTGLSVNSSGLLKRPSFHGLYWLGIGKTHLISKGDAIYAEICMERPWLTLCLDGCELGCHDGWQFHTPEYH